MLAGASQYIPLGGSSASVFSCNVDGWNCAMKEMDLSGMHGDSTSFVSFDAEMKMDIASELITCC